MYHVTSFKPVPPCYFCIAGFAPAQTPAFRQQIRAGCPVYGAVHTPAPQERLVGGINKGIQVQACDVTLIQLYLFFHDSAPNA
jgi:hypothetical protein